MRTLIVVMFLFFSYFKTISQNSDILYLAGINNSIVSINANTGKILQKIPIWSPSISTLDIDSSAIFRSYLNGEVISIDRQSFKLNWSIKIPGKGYMPGNPIIYKGDIIQVSDSSLYLVSSKYGKILWQKKMEDEILSDIKLDKDILYFTFRSRGLCAFDLINKQIKWKNMERNGGKISCEGNKIYQSKASGEIVSFDKFSGKVISSYKLDNSPSIFTFPLLDDGKIYVGINNSLVVLSSDSLKKLWEFKVNGSIQNSINIYKNFVIIGSGASEIYCINKNNGAINWTINTQKGYFMDFSLIYNENLFLFGKDDAFYSIDVNTGRVNWKIEETNYFVSYPIIVSHTGKIYKYKSN